MGSRITPADNRVLVIFKSGSIAGNPIAVDGAEAGSKNPVGPKLAVKVKPKGESTYVVAPAPPVTSDPAPEMAIGYSVRRGHGGGKFKTVIPKRRKLVKTMMYHSIKDFVKSFFRPLPPELHNRRTPNSQDLA